MSLPPPAADQAYCTVSVLEAGKVHMDLDMLIDTAPPGARVSLPDLAFLLRHAGPGAHPHPRPPFLFELGVRTDTANLPAGTRAAIAKNGIAVDGPETNLRAALERGGIAPDTIAHICISHIHLDHAGDPALFPRAQLLLGAGSEGLIAAHGPDFHDTFFAITLPPAAEEGRPSPRVTFLDPAGWPALGPFPRALDWYGDGSLYIVDAAGHVPGHVNVLARTSADGGWVYLAGDSAHDWRVIRGEARFACHPVKGCMHADLGEAVRHVERIRELGKVNPRVRVLLSHDVPWYEENKGGSAFWPGTLESL
ncbi:hypothetical protein C8Q78DRAFT_988585 [Trametes maxima]|nr:hypothetical protein C8Q78DRAFT_988585 [Trametes maxima]